MVVSKETNSGTRARHHSNWLRNDYIQETSSLPALADDEAAYPLKSRKAAQREDEDDSDVEDNHNESQGFLSSGNPRGQERKSRKRWITYLIAAFIFGLGILLVSASSGYTSSFTPWSGSRNVGQKPALIISSYRAQDVSWLTDVPKQWEIYRYCSDCLPGDKALVDVYGDVLPVPSLIGREAMAYLTFLIDNYDDLPPYMLFMHGHNTSWHQPENIISLLRVLNLAAVESDGYIPLKCSVLTCRPIMEGIDLTKGPDEIPVSPMAGGLKMLPAFWKYMFNSDEISVDQRISNPDLFAAVTGAQFAVSAATVHNSGLDLLKRLREPLMSEDAMVEADTALRYLTLETWGYPEGVDALSDMFVGAVYDHLDSYVVGSFFELLWPVIFGKGPVYCPATEMCLNTYLGGAIRCPDWDLFSGKTTNVTCEVDEAAMIKAEEMNRKVIEALS